MPSDIFRVAVHEAVKLYLISFMLFHKGDQVYLIVARGLVQPITFKGLDGPEAIAPDSADQDAAGAEHHLPDFRMVALEEVVHQAAEGGSLHEISIGGGGEHTNQEVSLPGTELLLLRNGAWGPIELGKEGGSGAGEVGPGGEGVRGGAGEAGGGHGAGWFGWLVVVKVEDGIAESEKGTPFILTLAWHGYPHNHGNGTHLWS